MRGALAADPGPSWAALRPSSPTAPTLACRRTLGAVPQRVDARSRLDETKESQLNEIPVSVE